MNRYLTGRAADVLLVVGDPSDLCLILDSLHQAKVKNRLHHVGSVSEASSYMRREGPYKYAPVPGLVLLDAGLPQRSVADFVAELKTDAQFAGIPVIAIVGSDAEHQLIENSLYAFDGSIRKPFSLSQLVHALISVETLSFLMVQSAPAT